MIYKTFLLFLFAVLCSCAHHPQNKATSYVDSSQTTARENAHLVFNYLHAGYTDFAKEKLELALHIAPDDPVILDTAGYYYEKTGRIKLANYYYKQAIKAAPYSGFAKNNYGSFLCRNGYYKASIPHFLQAAKMPKTSVTQKALENANFCKLQLKTKLGDSAT